MTTVNPAIFRAYDIRGIVDRDLSEEVYRTLGRASGTFFRQHERRRIVVARDARLTSPAYAAAKHSSDVRIHAAATPSSRHAAVAASALMALYSPGSGRCTSIAPPGNVR